MTLKAKHYNRILVIIGLLLVFTTPVFADDYETTIPAFNYGSYTVPAYDGDPSEAVNGNLPAFSSEELNAAPYVYYGDLDNLGRCTAASSLLSASLMPTGSRGNISSVYPTGWVQKSYDVVSGKYLYNRGIGSYSGYSKHYFIIVPAKAKIANARNSLAGAIRIEAKKQEGVSGYQYAWRMKGKTWAKVSYNRNVRIVKNLKKGKTYQVKVRTYKKINGKNWYGKWSDVKSVKVKK